MPPEPKVNSALAELNVLVVDGDESIRDLISKVLLQLGFKNVRGENDGYAAVDAMRETRIDLVITDWELKIAPTSKHIAHNASVIKTDWGDFPPNNGASFVEYLRRSKASPNPYVPIIMLTGPTTPNAIMYARDAGVNEMLLKPIDAKSLCNRIINVIDDPRPFVTSENYKGPCRRRRQMNWSGKVERRKRKIEVIRFEDHNRAGQ